MDFIIINMKKYSNWSKPSRNLENDKFFLNFDKKIIDFFTQCYD